jgi:NAD(P)-dependent dehydrogenase (short-subunit alcohol dehydrogenase family)
VKNVTVITGGCGGMGFATASIMGRQGDTVLLCDINEDALKSSADVLKRQHMDVHYAVVNVANPDMVRAAAQQAAEMGTVKKLIHTAGLSPIQVAKLEPETGALNIMQTNAMGTVNIIESFYPLLGEGAAVVCFSSSAIYMMPQVPESMIKVFDSVITDRENLEKSLLALAGGQPGRSYMFSKMFIKRYCEMNVGRLGHKGCRIVTIAPGRIVTPMHQALIDAEPERIPEEMRTMPLGRYGHAYEIGNLVDFLCSYRASYISGIDILMDEGTQAFITAPQFAD